LVCPRLFRIGRACYSVSIPYRGDGAMRSANGLAGGGRKIGVVEQD
jgi:hypothetical protein